MKRQAPPDSLPAAPPPLDRDRLRWRCDPGRFSFSTTAEVTPMRGVIGQDPAVEALRFGLECGSPGQNIFVRGLSGTGRMTLVRHLLEEIQPPCPLAQDRCYVHNFDQPVNPRLISLPRGSARAFSRAVDELVDFVRDHLPEALSSEAIKARIGALEKAAELKIKALTEPFEQALALSGLALVNLQTGPVRQTVLFPVHQGKAVPPEEFDLLRANGEIDQERYDQVKNNFARFSDELEQIAGKIREITKAHMAATQEFIKGRIQEILEPLALRIVADFPSESVEPWVKALLENIVEGGFALLQKNPEAARLYRVNVLLAHDGDSCPVIVENSPTHSNLVGSIDREFLGDGRMRTDHHMIRGGALLRADGGFLIAEARDVLMEPGAWKALTRTLRTGLLEIGSPEGWPYPWAESLKPEPVAINVKVILLGDELLFHLLDHLDPDFPHLFKVLAEFDSVIPLDDQALGYYGAILARLSRDEKLLPFDREAAAELAEHGARIAASQKKLTTRFGRLADVAREASFLAVRRGSELVGREDVRETVHRTRRRIGLPYRRFRELIADRTIRVQVSGLAVGQVNGLAVVERGPLTFGFPARITATIGPGSAGVINIEREADLSGAIHTKGFYILGGLLRYLLQTDHPLAFDASIAFEQSYGGIDGDSASGAEICCLLSALTGTPIRQEVAMTGAIDQVGGILAVGGVNEKIEGFFDACCELGLAGSQGVIIPGANRSDLMLRHDVVEACAEGRFHVWAVDTVGQALELLTGTPSGTRGETGGYPRDSVLGRAVARARDYWLMAAQAPRKTARKRATPPAS